MELKDKLNTPEADEWVIYYKRLLRELKDYINYDWESIIEDSSRLNKVVSDLTQLAYKTYKNSIENKAKYQSLVVSDEGGKKKSSNYEMGNGILMTLTDLADKLKDGTEKDSISIIKCLKNIQDSLSELVDINEKINVKGLDKGSLKDDLIKLGALKKGAPVYDADIDKVVKYALKNTSNERRVLLAKNFAVIRGSKQSSEEKAFWKAFTKKWEEEKDKK